MRRCVALCALALGLLAGCAPAVDIGSPACVKRVGEAVLTCYPPTVHR